MSIVGLPGRGERLLLEAALLSRERALASWLAWRDLSRDDPTPFDRTLFSLVAWNLGAGLPSGEPVAKVCRYAWLQSERLSAEAEPVLSALEEKGIPVLALKGLALGIRYYRSLGARLLVDLDLMVPASRFREARSVLLGLGWGPLLPEPPARLERFFHGHPYSRGTQGQIDLHRHLFWEASWPGADDEIWSGSEELIASGHRVRCLCPADQLLHVLVHARRFSRRPSVRWVADAVLVMRESAVDWDRLLSQTRRLEVVPPIRDSLVYLAGEWGSPVPAEVASALALEPVTRSRVVGYEARLSAHFSEEARPSIVPPPSERWPERLSQFILYLRFDARRCLGKRPSVRDALDYLDLLAYRWGFRGRTRAVVYLASLLTRRGLRTLARRRA